MTYYVLGDNVPDVRECFTPAGHDKDDPLVDCEWINPEGEAEAFTCSQCSGRHKHHWVRCSFPDGRQGSGIPVRCEHCGGRKCDMPGCNERRHHLSPHIRLDGTIIPVGSGMTIRPVFDPDD